MKELADLLVKWDQCTEKMRAAIESRQIPELKHGFRNGSRCFEELKFLIANTDKQALLQFGDEIKKTIDQWQTIAVKLKPWMDEIRAEIRKTKVRTSRNSKLSKTYGYGKQTGKYLRVKTR